MKTTMRIAQGLISAAFFLIGLQVTPGQPVIYQATGTKEEVERAVEQFKHDITYGVGGDAQHPPEFLGSYKVADFQGLNTGETSSLLPDKFDSGGLTFLSMLPCMRLSAGQLIQRVPTVCSAI
jgi:hypothetical protein